MQRLLISLLVVLPLCGQAAEPLSLAEAAERFAERSASLPTGSVQAQSIDRQIPLGNCASGWDWSFPYEARTTVQVSCTASPNPSRRFVAVRYPSSPAAASPQRKFVIATRDLAVGSVLGVDDLAVSSIPAKERAFSSTLSDPTALIVSPSPAPFERVNRLVERMLGACRSSSGILRFRRGRPSPVDALSPSSQPFKTVKLGNGSRSRIRRVVAGCGASFKPTGPSELESLKL